MRYLKLFLLTGIVILFAFPNTTHAKILRVGYGGLPVTGVDFTSISAAHTAAAVGDTLQIYGSVGSGTITKRLVIMGFGYNFDANPNLQVSNLDNVSDVGLTFQTGSDSSIAEGLDLSATIYASKIIIRRCRVSFNLMTSSAQINNVKIIGCVVLSGGMNSSSGNTCTNFRMSNCILSNSNTINFYMVGSTGLIENCVTNAIWNSGLYLNDAGFLVKNCILNGYYANTINTVYNNNIFGPNQPATVPLGTGNVWSQSWANIFERLGGNSDQPGSTSYATFDEDYYILKAGSPAINAGFDGGGNPTDCGIYGGEAAYRYKLSGVPGVPAIYKLSGPSATSTNPYNVTISVRSNN